MQVTTSKAAGARRQRLGGDLAVVEVLHPGLQRMQARHAQRLGGQVDARHVRRLARHRFGQDAAAAADVEHRLAAQAGQFVDPVQAQRVDLVQRAELAVRVPPAVGQITELGKFLGVDVSCMLGWYRRRARKRRKPRRSGVSSGESGALRRRLHFLARVPTTSISTRRFLARPSAVLLSATGCFSPLPSV
jgi:hypothetical protein